MLTKTQAAFVFQAQKLFEDHPQLYFWTVTFSTLHADWECAALFRSFLNHLREVMGRTGWGGVRVSELHQEHGVHYHLLVTERLAADLVRRVGRCHGIGWVKVKMVYDIKGAIDYLIKYLHKQKEGPKTQPRRKITTAVWSIGFANALLIVASDYERQRNGRRWASFGDIRRTRVKDVECDSPMWRFRKQHNLPFLTYRAEVILNRAWLMGEASFKSCWFALKRALLRAEEGFQDAIKLATEQLFSTTNGLLVERAPWDYAHEHPF